MRFVSIALPLLISAASPAWAQDVTTCPMPECPFIAGSVVWPEDGATQVPRNTWVLSHSSQVTLTADGSPIAVEEVYDHSFQVKVFRPSGLLPPGATVTIAAGQDTATVITGDDVDTTAPPVVQTALRFESFRRDLDDCEFATCDITSWALLRIEPSLASPGPLVTRVRTWSESDPATVAESVGFHPASAPSRILGLLPCAQELPGPFASVARCAEVTIYNLAGNSITAPAVCGVPTACQWDQQHPLGSACEPFTGATEPDPACWPTSPPDASGPGVPEQPVDDAERDGGGCGVAAGRAADGWILAALVGLFIGKGSRRRHRAFAALVTLSSGCGGEPAAKVEGACDGGSGMLLAITVGGGHPSPIMEFEDAEGYYFLRVDRACRAWMKPPDDRAVRFLDLSEDEWEDVAAGLGYAHWEDASHSIAGNDCSTVTAVAPHAEIGCYCDCPDNVPHRDWLDVLARLYARGALPEGAIEVVAFPYPANSAWPTEEWPLETRLADVSSDAASPTRIAEQGDAAAVLAAWLALPLDRPPLFHDERDGTTAEVGVRQVLPF